MKTPSSASTSGADASGGVVPSPVTPRAPRTRRARAGLLALVTICALAGAAAAQQAGRGGVQTTFDTAVDDFMAGRVRESSDGFDRVVKLAPEVMPQLWQRGIALYYAERYQDCRAQFESHRTVTPAVVENAVWLFLCVARLESPAAARKALLPVGADSRRPMREVYEMFRGDRTPDAVMAVAGDDLSARFYAALCVGLYYEALGDARARTFITEAAGDRFASVGGYMNRVAKVHMQVRRWDSGPGPTAPPAR
jgi:hypothetical protein